MIKEKLRALLAIKDKPHHVAMSFSVGVFIGMSPLLGLHTIIGLVCAYLFRMNKFVTITGVYVTNPWTIIPIYSFGTWSGMKIMGVEGFISDINWKALGFSNVLTELETLFWPFIVGTFFIGTISAVLSYITIYYIIKKRRNV